jgi:3-oxoacyl-[acyl-carrier protein] reductase
LPASALPVGFFLAFRQAHTMKRLDQKISLITGAAQGIGLATTLKFASEGATVIVCDLNQAAVDEAVRQCEALGATAMGFVMDVTQCEVVDAVVDAVMAQVKERFGRIDVLVNNAGITKDARLQKMTRAQFDQVININLRGVFHCAQAVADPMLALGSGVILNASSVLGICGNFGQTSCAISKVGVIGFNKTLAPRTRPQGHTGERAGARLCLHHHARHHRGKSDPGDGAPRAIAPAWQARRNRQRLRVSRQRQGQLHQQRGDRGVGRHDGVSRRR